MIEAEVQKKLTKGCKFFAGRLTRDLGLRYAPDLRFFKDDSLKQFKQVQDAARGYLKEYYEQERETKQQEAGELTGMFKEMAKPFMELRDKVAIFSRMNVE